MTAYTASTSGNVNVSTNWTPNGVPGTADTVVIGSFTMTIPALYTWTPGALALTGTGSSTRAKIVIASAGFFIAYNTVTIGQSNLALSVISQDGK